MKQQHHIDLLKKVLQAWEVAPGWQLGQFINYLTNFADGKELYNIPDHELAEICNKIVAERDSQREASFYTKTMLISAFNPTADTFLEITKQVLTFEEYDKVLGGIIDCEYLRCLTPDLQAIVEYYFQFGT